MAGDFTSVPWRTGDRWTAARMQQGRVLLDTDWNLTIDGAAAVARELARDAIGPYGVLAGSSAFAVTVAADGSVSVGAGSIWVDGLLAVNPADLEVADQPEIAPTPVGNVVVYLDVFVEEVQAAEDPTDLLDPALGGVDTTTRTRVGWRVHTIAGNALTCGAAAKGLPAGSSTGLLDIGLTAAPPPPDPCAPPDDPRVRLPDGLLRIEVLDSGDETTARFGWSYDDGASTVAATVAGATVTCAPSPSVVFAPGDLVEVSTLARRADRRDTGPLFTVAAVTPDAGGDVVTLSSASTLAGNPPGTCLRRWDGQVVGASAATALTLAGIDVGIAFTAHPGQYLAGDWWGSRVRGSAGDVVETRTAAPSDGVAHTAVVLAVVDTAKHIVLSDCRPTYTPLTELDLGTSTCTVTAFPGDDLQIAASKLPAGGGELCLAAGTFSLPAPLQLSGLQRIVVTGVGPATILTAPGHESVIQAQDCRDIEIRDLRVEASQPAASPPGEPHLLGALTFQGCQGVSVRDCEVWCPDSSGRAQSGVYVAPDANGGLSDDVRITGNRIEVGDQQVAILVVSCNTVSVRDNRISLAAAPASGNKRPAWLVATELSRYVASHVLTDADVKGGTTLQLPGGVAARIGGGTPIRRLATDWAKQATQAELTAAKTPTAALAKFARRLALDPTAVSAGRASLGFVRTSLLDARAVGQGIVVAGASAARVDIHDNVVQQVIQGVHVGLGFERQVGSAGQVSITRNTVGNQVPYFWQRSRHAFYVGSFDSLTINDNHAQLAWSGGDQTLAVVRPAGGMEAVRIWGRVGGFLQVRGLDLTGGYRTGVQVVDTGGVKGGPPGLHYVSDVLNRGGGVALSVPDWVARDRCTP